jgi:hypothetical protein
LVSVTLPALVQPLLQSSFLWCHNCLTPPHPITLRCQIYFYDTASSASSLSRLC